MGWDNIFHCEVDPFCRQVLNYYFPKAKSYGNIKETDFNSYRGRIDILTGGFPCQPYSTAGKRLGKNDPRHLWPDMLRAVREIQPMWVVGENVRGLISWDGGLVFHEVQSDLEAEGYEVLPLLLPAAGIGAPHRRDRIWFIAYRDGIGRNETRRNTTGPEKETTIRTNLCPQPERPGQKRPAADTDSNGRPHQEYNPAELPEEKRESGHSSDHGIAAYAYGSGFQKKGAEQQTAGFKQHGELGEFITYANSAGLQWMLVPGQIKVGKPFAIEQSSRYGQQFGWQDFPTQPPLCHGDDGLSDGLDGITFPKWRSESIKAGGNAIVPQIALQIFKVINELMFNINA